MRYRPKGCSQNIILRYFFFNIKEVIISVVGGIVGVVEVIVAAFVAAVVVAVAIVQGEGDLLCVGIGLCVHD